MRPGGRLLLVPVRRECERGARLQEPGGVRIGRTALRSRRRVLLAVLRSDERYLSARRVRRQWNCVQRRHPVLRFDLHGEQVRAAGGRLSSRR